MSEIGILVLFLLVFVIPLVGLYLAIDRETSKPTVLKRSDAEQLAQDRGGRPEARTEADSRQDSGDDEWGTTDEWGDRDRR